MDNGQFYEQQGFAMTCRSLAEYEKMFALEETFLEENPSKHSLVLDVAGGASSFTAEARNRGWNAIAVDPLYRLSPDEIAAHGNEEITISTGKIAKLTDQFNWDYYGSMDQHESRRRNSLSLFLADYTSPEAREVYLAAALPNLPFANNSFSLVLCSHFLFLYGEQLNETFHIEAVLELLRVCKPGGQIRIYPLVDLKRKPIEYLAQLISEINSKGASIELLQSNLAFMPEAEQLMCMHKQL